MAIETRQQQLCYEDVNEGDEMPSVIINLTVQRLIMAAGSNRDFYPVHHNSFIAKRSGAPDMFLNNVSTLSLWERALTDWIGLYGRIKRVSFRITDMHNAGEAIKVTGKVTRKWKEEGLSLLELEMLSTHSRGVCQRGSAVVALPSRSNPHKLPWWPPRKPSAQSAS